MKQITALVLSAVLILGMFTGCSGSKEDPYVPTGNALDQGEEAVTEPTQVTKGQISMPYYPDRTLNPYQCTDPVNKSLLPLMYQGLFALDQDYQTWPILCESYQVSWDMKTYTLNLAEATFSDGNPVTATDVVESLKKARNSDVYKGRFNHVDSIAGTEEGAVVITLKVPCENLPMLLDVPIVKADEIEAELPLGTGPYVLVLGEQPSLQRRTGWWCTAGVSVTAERIGLTVAESPSQLRDAFEFANLTLVPTDPGSDSYADYHSDYELWQSENGIFLYLGCNASSELLSRKEFRLGLLQAVDREGIASQIYRGFATATVLPASPNSPAYNSALAGQYPYSRGKLIQLIAANRELAATELTLLVNSDDGLRLRVAHKLKADLEECGLNIRISEQSTKDYTKALEEGNYDLYLGQTKLSPNMDLSAFFAPEGKLSFGGMESASTYSLCLEALANIGNYYNLHQRILEDGMLCPILFRSYAVYTQRGSFPGLTPARDNLFFYHRGRTMEEALITE